MKSLSIIALLIIFCEIKAQDDECFKYEPVSNIGECIGKQTGRPHYGCCGLNITTPKKYNSMCIPVGNTRASRDVFKIAQEIAAKRLNGTLDFKCSNQEDEIKGNCDDFLGVMVNDKKDCLKLTELNNTKVCCGLKANIDISEQGSLIPTNICLGLPKDKNQRDEYIKQLENGTEGMMKIDEYTCDNGYLYLIKLIYICSLFLLF